MPNQLPKIDFIVQLMLENRPFDQMLGFLYTNEATPNVSPAGHPYEGLTGAEFNLDSAGNKVPVFRIDQNTHRPYLMPKSNPREGFQATNLQLFGVNSPAPGALASNSGFVVSFENAISYDRSRNESDALPETKPSDIMGMYDPSMLPVMTALARGFAVCDHWFASVPTETFPNRAFACTGTSLGHLGDDFKILNTPSIFGRMSTAKLDWGAYGYTGYPYVRTDYPDTKAAPKEKFGHFSDFYARVKAGTLPSYTFLEPGWGAGGNSQHPVTDVSLGEKLIYDVYTALRSGPGWDRTLLIITYDEAGGGFDHVQPPATAVQPDSFKSDEDHQNFDFTRFGVRVPALLISPLIAPGTVFRAQSGVIDHTSVIKTLCERWPKIKSLTKRDAAAPSLGDALTLAVPRTDDPLVGVTPPTSGEAVPNAHKPSKLQKRQAGVVAALPIPNEYGTYDHDQPTLTTAHDYAEYIRDRTAAWEDHVERRKRTHAILRPSPISRRATRGPSTQGGPPTPPAP
ncbi:MAG: phosphoesterase [Proteobacteria bacterium]|nr:phosphoesterase [Pseudomonadota bacterium]